MTTPNEPNKARTIPLHIADQAVAACEAEIQKLKEENARLKGEDYAYNELGSLVPRHLLEHWMHENARLKAEVERLDGVIKEVVKEAQENSDRYVRRLNKEAAHPACVAMNRKLGDANNEIHRLKAEVERLRKAGDWMCGLLQFDFVTKEWNAAKKGKPSA